MDVNLQHFTELPRPERVGLQVEGSLAYDYRTKVPCRLSGLTPIETGKDPCLRKPGHAEAISLQAATTQGVACSLYGILR